MSRASLRALAVATAWATLLATDSAAADPIQDEDLVGTWDWIQTIAGWAGIKTPETEGYSQTLELRSDGTYDLLRNGLLHQSGAWELSDLASGCGSAQSLWIEDLTPLGSAVRLEADSLVFGMLCVDGWDYYFQRRTEVGAAASSWGALKANAQRRRDR